MSDPLAISPKPRQPTRGDWIRYVVLIMTWGSAFSLSKIAVAEMPPTVLTAGRIWVGIFLLYGWMRFCGHQLPKLFPKPDIRWLWFVPIGATGAALPFILNAWALQSLDSGLTSILLATMPLSVAFLTHFTIPGDRMNGYKIGGLLLGLGGIVILMGPDSLRNLGGTTSLAQLAVLASAMLYAVNAVLIHFMPETSPSVSATGMLIIGGLIMLPFAVHDGLHMQMPPLFSLAAVFFLGFGATGFGSILYMQTIRSAGPTFMATSNYFVPPFAVFVGVLFLNEQPGLLAFVALAIISLGLFLERKGLK
jgi:drug/metabolite transporter (DMT)-like permease